MADELRAACSIIVSYETMPQWARKFGQGFANEICRSLPVAGDRWYTDNCADDCQREALLVARR
jgi:putative transposase